MDWNVSPFEVVVVLVAESLSLVEILVAESKSRSSRPRFFAGLVEALGDGTVPSREPGQR